MVTAEEEMEELMSRVSLGNDENILKLIVVIVTQSCEHTKTINCTLLIGESCDMLIVSQ